MMKETQKWLSKYFRVVQYLLLLIGVMLVLLSILAPSGSRWSLALFGLGNAVVASTLLALIHSALGTDVRAIVEECLGLQHHLHEMGLEKIHPHIGDEAIFERFWNAHTIDVMYNTAKNATFRYGNRIKHAIATRGCRVRILISDTENPFMNNEAIVHALCPGTDIRQEVKDVIAHINILIDELKHHEPSLKAGSLEVRAYPFVPTCSIVIVDGEVGRHTAYLPYTHSSEVPIYDVTRRKGHCLLEQYQDTFNRVWVRSKTVCEISFTSNHSVTATLPEESAKIHH